MLVNAKGYSSYFETEHDGIWYLSPEGWVPADSNQISFVKTFENSCSPYQLYDYYEDPVEQSPVGCLF